MQDTNGRDLSPLHAGHPEWDDQAERRRTYPEDAPQEWEDEYVELGGEGG